MEKQAYLLEDVLERVGVSEEVLESWEVRKLVQPLGRTDDERRFFSEAAVERMEQIKQLMDLGYELDEIQKIIKKVGLPRGGESGPHEVDDYLTVGQLAEKVGVSPRTLKHWEDKGIIEPELRSGGGFRLYSNSYVTLCQLIQDLQLFGFSLDQIQALAHRYRMFLSMQDNPELYSKADSQSRLDEMTEELDRLKSRIDSLRQGIDRWDDLLKRKQKELAQLHARTGKRQEDA